MSNVTASVPHGNGTAGVHNATAHARHHRGVERYPPANPQAALVVYLVMFTLVGAQLGVVWWKHNHQRSYDMVSLVGLWLIPAFVSIVFRWWTFLTAWLAFSCVTIYMFVLCMRKGKLSPTTPRLIFTWFLYSHHVCVAVGAVGYLLFLLQMLGVPPFLGKDSASLLLWYGLYFGILGRDTAEVAFTGLAATMSYGRKLSVNPNICALCNKPLEDMSHVGGEAPEEETIQLPCKHLFHALCLRGWTMVGKKDSCPTCLEKTDLRALYSDRPWEARNLQWNGMLDFVRYMVVWFPIIASGLWVMLHLFHLNTNGEPSTHVLAPERAERIRQ